MQLVLCQTVKEWEAVKAKKSIKAYEDFIDKFPDGKYSALAGQEILELIKAGDTGEKGKLGIQKKAIVTKKSTMTKTNRPTIAWAVIPAGEFLMGSEPNESGREKDEAQHKVAVRSFKMSKYEITVGQYLSFVEATGYKSECEKNDEVVFQAIEGSGDPAGKMEFAIDATSDKMKPAWRTWSQDENGSQRQPMFYNFPVIWVSYKDATAFADWMGCRLPTEAEWEYACRAGKNDPFSSGKTITTEQANFNGNVPYEGVNTGNLRGRILAVGLFSANGFGLYDMEGNVSEMTSSKYVEYNSQTDLTVYEGSNVAVRGGNWASGPNSCRNAYRSYTGQKLHYSTIGFRIAY